MFNLSVKADKIVESKEIKWYKEILYFVKKYVKFNSKRFFISTDGRSMFYLFLIF